jgi:hypothetical protein
VWLFGIAGLVLFARRERALGAGLLGFFLYLLWLNQLPFDFWGGAGLGSRRFVPAALGCLIGVATLIEIAGRKLGRYGRVALVVGLLPFVALAERSRRDLCNNMEVAVFGVPPARTAGAWLASLYRRYGWPFSWPENLLWARRWGTTPDRYDLGAAYMFDNEDDGVARRSGDGWALNVHGGRLSALVRDTGWSVTKDGLVLPPGTTMLWINLSRPPSMAGGTAVVSALRGNGPVPVAVAVNGVEVARGAAGDGPTRLTWGRGAAPWRRGTNGLTVTSVSPVLLRRLVLREEPRVK